MGEEVYRYRAFISYRHCPRDRKWARWLLENLETFRTPRQLVRAGAPLRIGRLYRDDDEVPASSDLSNEIENSLRASQFLIVVCSRDTPKSKWVRREIEFFRRIGRGNRILALLVDGEPNEAFPSELLRVPVERVASDGRKTIEHVDSEPIASDVRPRSDERRSITERRAFLRIAAGLLGVSYDDLVRREQQRRVRQQRLLGSVAAGMVLCAAAGAYAFWDYNRVKVRYYADIGTRWGVPLGIGELDSETASHRIASYAVASERGFVVDIRRINGSGGPNALNGDGLDAEPWYAGVAEWRIPYPGDRAAEIDLYGATGRQVRTERYTWQPDGSAAVSFSGSTGGAQALNAGKAALGDFASSNSGVQKSQIAQHRLIFDNQGLVTKRFYQTVWGAPARDGDGSFGRMYEYTAAPHIAAYRNLGVNGEPLIERNGVREVLRNFLPSGDMASAEWRDTHGQLILNSLGYAKVRIRSDLNGNPIGAYCLDERGKPALSKEGGVASWTTKYDVHGNQVEGHDFGTDGKPILRKDTGAASWSAKYDDRGNPIEQDFFGIDGKPILRKDLGAASWTAKYDDRGNQTKQDFFGIDGKSILRKDVGIASGTWKYDDRGNRIEEHEFGTDGKPILSNDAGVASWTAKYDDRGNEVEQDFFGTDAKPILRRDDGFAFGTAKYDDRGNQVEDHGFGTDGKPILRKNTGAASWSAKYDDRGNQIEQDFFGTDGRPILCKDEGDASWRAKYDDRGNQIEQNFFGIEGKPNLRRDTGAASLTVKYDGRGNQIEEHDFGIDAKLILRKDTGAASWTVKYDHRGNQIEQDFFGTDGKPVLRKDVGVASFTFKYDGRGNPIEQHFFGTDGKPVLHKDLGVASWTAKYDDRGNQKEQDFFGTDGKVIARSVRLFDSQGDIISQHLLDASGREIHPRAP